MHNSKQWRNYFEKATDDNKNYKLFIETAYGCHGSCAGCPLSIESRNSEEPKWELTKLKGYLQNFGHQLLDFRQNNHLSKIENLAVTCGPAENLYFSADYLKELSLIVKNFAQQLNVDNFHLALTTSGLFSESKVIEKLKALTEHLDRSQLSFAFIVNIKQFEKTPQHYFNFAKLLFQFTDLVELEINMDTNIHNIKQETLQSFSLFVNSFPFVQLDFAYAINEGNQTKTYLKSHQFFEFINYLRSLTNNDNREFFSQWHSKLNPVKDNDVDFLTNFDNCFNNIISTHIRLNAMGEWHFAKNILGTLYYDQTFNFKPQAVGFDNPFSTENITSFKSQLFKFFNKILLKHSACEECEWKNICVNSGFIGYSYFSDTKETTCSNPAYTIFNMVNNV